MVIISISSGAKDMTLLTVMLVTKFRFSLLSVNVKPVSQCVCIFCKL
jgi:hypothetical protein